MNKICHFLCLLLMLATSRNTEAKTYYVGLNGNNANTGLSISQAFLTIQTAVPLLKAGDSVIVSDGFYAGFDMRSASGKSGSLIVFKALGSNVTINSRGPSREDGINVEGVDFIEINGFRVIGMAGAGNGIRFVNANNCIVRNCFCDQNSERGIFTGFTDDILIEYNISNNAQKEHGIYVSNSSDRPIIRYNSCSENHFTGIHMNADASLGGDGIISDAQVYGNTLFENGGAAGINMDGVLNPLIYNNLIYNNHNAQGIALFKQNGKIVSSGAKIYNNTIVVPSDGRWGILVMDGANINTQIFNNVIVNLHTWRGSITVEDTTSLLCDYNIVNDKLSNKGDGSSISFNSWKSLGFDSHSIVTSDLSAIFQDFANSNYELKKGSIAVDKGTNQFSSVVNADIIGTSRPQNKTVDIGAYELVQSSNIDHSAPQGSTLIEVFPNPTTQVLSLKIFKSNIKIIDIKMIDVQGKQNHIQYDPFTNQLDLKQLHTGIYVLQIQFDDGNTVFRQIVLKP